MNVYVIKRVVNNNVVISSDGKGREVFLRGKGIGFNKKPGMEVSETLVEKEYLLKDGKRESLLKYIDDIPAKYFAVARKILVEVGEEQQLRVGQEAVLALADHIHFAVKRQEEGLLYGNPMMYEIRTYYPVEYKAGKRALEIIKADLGIALPEDEIGFIAFHIVTLRLGTPMDETFFITEMIRNIIKIVEECYGIQLKDGSDQYQNLVAHLKFFGQRIFQKDTEPENDTFLIDLLKERYPKAYDCAKRIREFILSAYKKDIGPEEMSFLLIHMVELNF